jgi:hypothetical protein
MQTKDVRQQLFEHINAWKASGVTQKDFCGQANIPYHIFHYWYKVYRDLNKVDSSSFVKLQVNTAVTSSVELVFPDGKRLLFHQPVSADYLKALIS